MASSSGAKPPAAAVPITAKRMRDLLTSMGADEYEPRVLHQLLEFMNSYATDMLQDAALYAEHAGHPGEIEVADVELATKLRRQQDMWADAPVMIGHIGDACNKRPIPPLPPDMQVNEKEAAAARQRKEAAEKRKEAAAKKGGGQTEETEEAYFKGIYYAEKAKNYQLPPPSECLVNQNWHLEPRVQAQMAVAAAAARDAAEAAAAAAAANGAADDDDDDFEKTFQPFSLKPKAAAPSRGGGGGPTPMDMS